MYTVVADQGKAEVYPGVEKLRIQLAEGTKEAEIVLGLRKTWCSEEG
jgi:hypothetical protein